MFPLTREAEQQQPPTSILQTLPLPAYCATKESKLTARPQWICKGEAIMIGGEKRTSQNISLKGLFLAAPPSSCCMLRV